MNIGIFHYIQPKIRVIRCVIKGIIYTSNWTFYLVCNMTIYLHWMNPLNILRVCVFWRPLMTFFVMSMSRIYIFWCARMLSFAYFTKVETTWFAETNRKFSTKIASKGCVCNLLMITFPSIVIIFFRARCLLKYQLFSMSYVLVFNFWQVPQLPKAIRKLLVMWGIWPVSL